MTSATPSGVPTTRTISASELLTGAVERHRQGDVAGARARYTLLLVVDPGNRDALHLLGLLIRREPDGIGMAIRMIRRALAINPSFREAHINLINTLFAKGGDEPMVMGVTANAVAIAPDDSQVLHLRAAALITASRLDEALPLVRALLRLDPNNGEARRLLILIFQVRAPISITKRALRAGLDHERAGRLMDAEMSYRQVIRATPCDPDAMYLLAGLALRTGRVPLATYLIGRARTLAPVHAEYRNLETAIRAAGSG